MMELFIGIICFIGDILAAWAMSAYVFFMINITANKGLSLETGTMIPTIQRESALKSSAG